MDIDYTEYGGILPFIRFIEEVLGDLTDGSHYFEFFDEKMVMELPFHQPATPAAITGRQMMIQAWKGYGNIITLDHMSDLVTYRTEQPGVVILTYQGHGVGTQTGIPYHQFYVSIVTIKDRKIVHWIDYSNPMQVLNTIGGADAMAEAMYSEA